MSNFGIIEAEQSVIGSMLMDAGCIRSVVDELSGEDFSLKVNRDIYETIDQMYSMSKRIDVVTVLEQMRLNGTFDDSTRDYLLQIHDITPTSANVDEYIKIVHDAGIRRKIREKLAELMEDGTSSGEQLLASLQDAANTLSQQKSSGLISMAEMSRNFFEALEERQRGVLNTVSTSHRKLDEILSGGFLKKGLYILAGRPGMGKTSLAINIAMRAAGSTLFITLEMDEAQLTPRIYAALSGISSERLLTGRNLTQQEFGKLAEASTKAKQQFYINTLPSMDVGQIGRLARSVPNLSLIVVDYIGLIEGKGKDLYSRVTDISRELKQLARRLDVPVLALAQLNRAVEGRSDKRPTLADLRDSGAIEQDADGVLFTYRPDYYDKNAPPKREWEPSFVEVCVAKHRHGRTGAVAFNAYMANCLFNEI